MLPDAQPCILELESSLAPLRPLPNKVMPISFKVPQTKQMAPTKLGLRAKHGAGELTQPLGQGVQTSL